MAVGKVAGSGETAVAEVARERSNGTSFEVNLEDVSHEVVEEEKTPSITRPVRPHAGFKEP